MPRQESDAGVISRILSQFPTRPSVTDAMMLENIQSALGRNLLRMQVCNPHDRVMSIAAGGPSLEDTWRDLDGVIVAVNGSLKFLLDRGIKPWACGIFDPNEHLADIIDPHPEVFFFLGATCHPKVFDKLKGCKVLCWVPGGMPGLENIIPAAHDLVGGGCTMGLRWLNLGYMMGFRKFEVHGLDSSFRGRKTHAYPDRRDKDDPELVVDGYGTAINFIQQIKDWFAIRNMFDMMGDVTINLHGDGLLQKLDRDNPPDASKAVYEFSHAPASYDFAAWLVSAEMHRIRKKASAPLKVTFAPGPNAGFRADCLPNDAAERAVYRDNVLRPMLPLIGAIEENDQMTGYRHPYLFGPIVDSCWAGEEVPRFSAPAHAREYVSRWLAQ